MWALVLFMPCPFVMFSCWQAGNLSSFSPLLHRLHVSSPKAPVPCHTSSPSNLRQGAVSTRASKIDHFLEKSFNCPVRRPRVVRAMRCAMRDLPRMALLPPVCTGPRFWALEERDRTNSPNVFVRCSPAPQSKSRAWAALVPIGPLARGSQGRGGGGGLHPALNSLGGSGCAARR